MPDLPQKSSWNQVKQKGINKLIKIDNPSSKRAAIMQRETWQTCLKNFQSSVWFEIHTLQRRRWHVGVKTPSVVLGIQPTQSTGGSEPPMSSHGRLVPRGRHKGAWLAASHLSTTAQVLCRLGLSFPKPRHMPQPPPGISKSMRWLCLGRRVRPQGWITLWPPMTRSSWSRLAV